MSLKVLSKDFTFWKKEKSSKFVMAVLPLKMFSTLSNSKYSVGKKCPASANAHITSSDESGWRMLCA